MTIAKSNGIIIESMNILDKIANTCLENCTCKVKVVFCPVCTIIHRKDLPKKYVYTAKVYCTLCGTFTISGMECFVYKTWFHKVYNGVLPTLFRFGHS